MIIMRKTCSFTHAYTYNTHASMQKGTWHTNRFTLGDNTRYESTQSSWPNSFITTVLRQGHLFKKNSEGSYCVPGLSNHRVNAGVQMDSLLQQVVESRHNGIWLVLCCLLEMWGGWDAFVFDCSLEPASLSVPYTTLGTSHHRGLHTLIFNVCVDRKGKKRKTNVREQRNQRGIMTKRGN